VYINMAAWPHLYFLCCMHVSCSDLYTAADASTSLRVVFVFGIGRTGVSDKAASELVWRADSVVPGNHV